jgi:hypothetical protein
VQDSYVINTCEWPNGAHTIFATASVQTGASGAHDVSAVGMGYGVSAFVPVTFTNLITRISFSEPFFTPEDGQTQHISAVFAANVDWTLEIQDATETSVRTTNGSGGSLSFDWDGTDDSGVDLPVGNYTYLITAETNGLALLSIVADEETNDASAFPAMMWALAPDGQEPIPFELYPVGFDTNSLELFEATPAEIATLKRLANGSLSSSISSGGGVVAAAFSGPSGQDSRAPKRPPIRPVKGRAGVYGFGYDTYSAQGTNGFSIAPPLNGILTQRVGLEGFAAGQSTFSYPPLAELKRECANFVKAMQKGNWSQGFGKADDKLLISDLRGSGSVFNTVKLAFFDGHATYGTGQDFTSGAGGSKQMYYPITAGHSAQYLRMSEMSLGGSGANGLKWMAFKACNSLQHTDWANMQSMGVKPYNNDMHIILGTDTVVWTDQNIMALWGQYMTRGKGTNAPMKITDAWINAAKDAYKQSGFNYTNAIKFAYAADTSCINDKLSSTNTPGGTWSYSSQQVWP